MPLDPTDPLSRALGVTDLAANAPLSPSINAVDLAARTQAFPEPQDKPIRSLPAWELPGIYGSEFTRGLRRGALSMLGTTQSAVAQAVEPFSAKMADEMFAEANKTLTFAPGLRPKVEAWKDVTDPSSFASYGLSKAGEALPSTVASLGAAGLGGAAGFGLRALTGARVPLGFAAGAASMFPQEAGEAALTMHNDPAVLARTTPWERAGLAGAKGAVNAALEFAPEAVALHRAFGAPSLRRGFGPALGAVGRGAAEAAAGEAVTEGLQEKTGQIFHGLANPARDVSGDPEAIREAMIGGAFGGVGMGAAGGATHALRSNVPELPTPPPGVDLRTPEGRMEAGRQLGKLANTAEATYQRAADSLTRFVQEMGQSANKGVRESLEWSQDKENKLQLMLAHPEHGEELAKLSEEGQRAVIETLDIFQKGPGEAKKRHAAAYEHLKTLLGEAPEDLTLGPEADYSEFDYTGKPHPTKEGMVRFSDLQEQNFEDATQLTERGSAGEMEKPLQPPLNSEILSKSLSKAEWFKRPVLGRPQNHLTIRLQSDDMSPQEIIDALKTEGSAEGTARKNFAELHISPFSLANEIARNPATKETLPDIREGQTGTSDAHKADTIITALSTLINNGLTVNGKKVNVKVPEVPRTLLLGKNVKREAGVEPYTVARYLSEKDQFTPKPRAQLDVERNVAQLALDRGATEEDIAKGLAKLDARRRAEVPWRTEDITSRYNALKDFQEQVAATKERTKDWKNKPDPVQSTAEFALKKNAHYTAIDNLTTLAETAKEEIHNNPGGESIGLAQDLRSFIESDGEIATERVKKLLKASGAGSLREGALASQYMTKHKARTIAMLENLEQQAESAALSGTRSQEEISDIEGGRAENVRKDVYGSGANLPPAKLGKAPAPAVPEVFRPQAKKYPPGPMSEETAAIEAEARAERKAIQAVEKAEPSAKVTGSPAEPATPKSPPGRARATPQSLKTEETKLVKTKPTPDTKRSEQTGPTPGRDEYYVSESEDGFDIHDNIAGEKHGFGGPGEDELTGAYKTRAQAEAAIVSKGYKVVKESQQTGKTPGYEPKRTTHAKNTERLVELAKKMFGEKIQVVVGTPKGEEDSGARGWYIGRKQLDEYKATEAKIEQIRKDRREALKNGDAALADSLLDSEAKLLKQNEIVGTIYIAPHLANAEMLPTFYHEAVHAAFDTLLTPAERAALSTAFSRGLARRRLEELFKNDPGALGQLKDAEEAAAYGFQIYAVAPHLLELGPQTKTIFGKVKNWFRKLLGLLTPEEKAEVIMNQMLSGVRAQTGLSPLQRLLDKDAPTKDKVRVHANALKDVVKSFWDTMATPTYNRLVDSGNPALAAFARLGYSKTGEKGQLGMIQKQQNEITSRLNWVNKFTKKFSPEELTAAVNARLAGKLPPLGRVRETYDELETFFNDFHKYAEAAGVVIGKRKHYWPMLWDADKVMKGREAFLKLLAKPEYKVHMDELKVTPTELWENISGYVTRGDSFQGVLGTSGEPVNAYARERSLSFLDPEDRKPFMSDDHLQTMTHYVSNMVRQTEFVRSYGQGGAEKTRLLAEAEKKYGATKEDIKLANDYLDALLGNKEIGMSRELKDIYGAAIVYQNYRLLPYSLFTSLVDPLGIAVRSNNISDALEAFGYSLKNIFRDVKKERPDADKDYWQKLAEDWGYIEDAGTMSNLRHMAETTELHGFSKKMNDALFKYNLLNGWTRSTKIMAVKAAQRFFLRSAEGTDALSARNLEEVGLKKSDIIADGKGGIALRKDELMAQGVSEAQATEIEARLREATTKFVNQAILNPTAADLPNWGSNPYLAPVFHLKQFMFTFQNTIGSRILKEAAEGNYKPLWIAGIYIPGMIGADFLRGMVSNMGDIPDWQQNWGATDYVLNGVARSGLVGVGQLMLGLRDDISHGGQGYESLTGPTVEQIMKALKSAQRGDMAMWNFIVKAMPLNPIYDQWILSKHPEKVING